MHAYSFIDYISGANQGSNKHLGKHRTNLVTGQAVPFFLKDNDPKKFVYKIIAR